MNRKQKIIVSITGIILVSLILIGLTYAYFLTKITGNTNEKSISVTTANLELVYGDENGEIVGDKIQPGSKLTDTNGNEYKTFTVTNNGDDVDYSVVLENVTVTDVEKGTSTTFVSNDFVYTLTCTSSDETNSPCTNQVTTETTLPLTDSVLLGNNIKKGVIHTYTLVVLYKDTGIDQSDDMNKALSARINIIDIRSKNPYDDDKTSLAYNIINNASYAKGLRSKLVSTPYTEIGTLALDEMGYEFKNITYTTPDDTEYTHNYKDAITYFDSFKVNYNEDTGKSYVALDKKSANQECEIGKYFIDFSNMGAGSNLNSDSPYFKVVECKNGLPSKSKLLYFTYDKEKVMIKKKSVLSTATDDYGTSYYFRGQVEDNYVNFAGLCWKIVRINGDGSIKLYLANKNATCSENMTYENASIGSAKYGHSKTESGKYKLNYLNSEESGLADLFKSFQTSIDSKNINSYLPYLKKGGWCNDKNYDKKVSSLLCTEPLMNKFADGTDMYVGTLNANEMYHAGLGVSNDGESIKENLFFLNYKISYVGLLNYNDILSYSDSSTEGLSNLILYVTTTEGLSSELNSIIAVGINGPSKYTEMTSVGIPAVNLKKGITISGGDGTISNPYVVKTN